MDHLQQTSCLSCERSFYGNYCPTCGLKANPDRLSFTHLKSEIAGGIFQFNHKLLRTVKALTFSPGEVVGAYLKGNRKKYFKPLAYVFSLSTIFFFLSQTIGSGTFIGDAIEGLVQGGRSGLKDDTLAALEWLSEHYSYTILLLLPIFSLATFLSFKSYKLNYVEHLVLNAYINGQQAIIYSLLALAGIIIPNEDLVVNITLLLSIGYATYSYNDIFNGGSTGSTVLRTLLTYILYILSILILSIAIFALGSLYFKIFSS